MTTKADLRQMFVVAEVNLAERWKSMGILEKPKEIDVWERMKTVASEHFVMLTEDKDPYAEVYKKRVEAIEKIIKKLKS